jgi:hypothetical protein
MVGWKEPTISIKTVIYGLKSWLHFIAGELILLFLLAYLPTYKMNIFLQKTYKHEICLMQKETLDNLYSHSLRFVLIILSLLKN